MKIEDLREIVRGHRDISHRCYSEKAPHEIASVFLDLIDVFRDAVVKTGIHSNDYQCRICEWKGFGPRLIHKKNCPVAAVETRLDEM